MSQPTLKPILFLGEQIERPPFSREASREVGYLLHQLQTGVSLGMPQSRPMPSIEPRVHELRVREVQHNWRIVYRVDATFIVVVMIFDKKTPQTPNHVIALCQHRLARYDKPENI